MPNKNIPHLGQNCYIDERGFLYFKLVNQENCNLLTIEQLNKLIVDVSSICENSYMPFLVDLRYATGVASYSTFKLLAKDIQLKSVCSKIAFIVNSLPLKILIHNYIKINKPKIPSQVYYDIDGGINYCLTP